MLSPHGALIRKFVQQGTFYQHHTLAGNQDKKGKKGGCEAQDAPQKQAARKQFPSSWLPIHFLHYQGLGGYLSRSLPLNLRAFQLSQDLSAL